MELIDRIFQGAIEEFKENGIKFTMDSLSKRIGISKRTLYETVASKNDVINIVIDRTFQDVKEQQKVILEDSTLSTKERLKRLFSIIPTYASVIDYRRMNEIKIAYPLLYIKIQNNLENDWEPTIALLEKAMDESIIRKVNIVILKMLLCDVYEQLINGTILIQNNISYETAMEEIINLLFDGLYLK